MNVLIISTNRNRLPMPVLPAGSCMVAEEAEQAGHSVTFLDLMFQRDPLVAVKDCLSKKTFDVIGLSVRNIDNNDMYGTMFYIQELIPLVAEIRRFSKAFIVLGGASLGVMPEEILRAVGADCAVIGEGEAVFPRLLERISGNEPYEDLPGIAFIRGGVFIKNESARRASNQCAMPAYDRWLNLRAYRSSLSTAPLQTKLGCQFQCVYCTYQKIEGAAYRLFDPESVPEAAVKLTAMGLHDIEFVDNVFNAPLDHALSVCEALIHSRVRARFQSLELNPVYFHNDLITAMERAGFVGIGITVESGSDAVLRGLRKGFTAGDVRQTAEIVRCHGLPCIWMFLLGGPDETRETVRETLGFAATMISSRDAAFFNIGIRIYPGTELESIARRQGVLSKLAGEMLAPVFYVSPSIEASWIRRQVENLLNDHLNFMSADSFRFPYLPLIHRIGYRLGLHPPLWRYTSPIRRGLRFIGMKV